jgi:cation transport ATPase
MTPETGLDTVLWQPVVFAALIYAVLYVIGNVLDGRNDPRGEMVHDLGFGLILLTGAYTVVLTIMALIQRPSLVGDMLLIIAIIVAFFALLVLLLYAVFELLLPRLRGGQRG